MSESRPPEIVVRNEQQRPVDCERLAELAGAVLAAEAKRCNASWDPEAELSVVIGDDAWIGELNRMYRNRDAATDVLAFPQGALQMEGAPEQESPPPAEQNRSESGLWLLGDVAISAETAARQAEELGHGFEEEMAVLLAHGILHLTGWRDYTGGERQRMMRRVEEVLARARSEG